MKRSLSMMVAVLCVLATSFAYALTQTERTSLVGGYLPEDAVFVREETDDGAMKLKYETIDKTGEYEIELDQSGSRVTKVSYDLRNDAGGAKQALNDADAFVVVQKVYADATLVCVTQEKDDGRFETKVAFSTPALTGEYTLNAEDATVMEYELYPLSEMKTDEQTATELLQTQHAGATVLSVKKDTDDKHAEYEGKASLDGRVYEFSIDIGSGKITEWELDD